MKAFTLIELLIVVAIIAILAAIAVPNFLEAQTRSKVSRAKADMRTIATAVESYFVDNNRYPFTPPDISVDVDGYGTLRQSDMLTIPDSITTPISYISSHIPDVFKLGRSVNGPSLSGTNSFGQPYESGNPRDVTFLWLNMEQAFNNGNPSGFGFFGSVDSWEDHFEAWGGWQMRSMGTTGLYPGAQGFEGVEFISVDAIYDPTNGTVSTGMVIRNQKSAEGDQQAANE